MAEHGTRPARLGPGCVLGLLMLLPCPSEAQQLPSDEELELMLRYTVEDVGVPGVVAGALDADGSVRVVAYGSGGAGAPPLGPRSVFEIGSITKTFTGTLLADMVARGEVALDDPVSLYLPDDVTVPSRRDRRITLLDLATHRSGLPRSARNVGASDPEEIFADRSVEKMYEFLSAYELGREPGAEYTYSNLGFDLLGHALARASGQRLPDLVRERILHPVGMEMTGYAPTGAMAEWMTRGHEPGVVPIESDVRRGAGGIFSNARDMLTYLQANVGPPQTDLERAMRMAQRPRASTDQDGIEVGLAWRTLTAGDRSIVSHGGRRTGYRAFAGFDPERRIGLVLLANTDALPTERGAGGGPGRRRDSVAEGRGRGRRVVVVHPTVEARPGDRRRRIAGAGCGGGGRTTEEKAHIRSFT